MGGNREREGFLGKAEGRKYKRKREVNKIAIRRLQKSY